MVKLNTHNTSFFQPPNNIVHIIQITLHLALFLVFELPMLCYVAYQAARDSQHFSNCTSRLKNSKSFVLYVITSVHFEMFSPPLQGFGNSSTSGFNFSNPGITASAGLTFGVSNPASASFGTGGQLLQLKKPPAGNKRGKR